MQLKDINVSLELARQLKEAGYPQESLFYWAKIAHGYELCRLDRTDGFHSMESNDFGMSRSLTENYAAPTASELGEQLPVEYKSYRNQSGAAFKWDCEFTLSDGYRRTSGGDTEADARARMWLFLEKKGLLTSPNQA